MKDTLVKTIKKKKLFTDNQTIIIAVSGGVDSMVLLDILSKIHPTNKLVIAHVNHKKRLASEEEYKAIKEIAKQYRIPFEGYTFIHQNTNNFQAEARKARYQFFFALAVKYGAKTIVTAHHLDDQIETILMRLTRGSSFSGYSGMKSHIKKRNYEIVRPFLDIPKDELYEYAKTYDIPYFEDESNKDDIYTRNRFRNQLIPLLKEENPLFYEKMNQFTQYMEDADDILDKACNEFMKKYYMYASIPVEPFNKLDHMIQIKVLERVINKSTNDSVEVSYKQYQKLIELADSDQPNQFYALGKEYEWIKEYDVFYIEKVKEVTPINIEITAPGEYFVDDNISYIFTYEKLEHNHRNYYELCYNEKVFPLYLRNRKNGDRIKLKEGTKKEKEILIDQKIPLSKRDKLILLTDQENVYWIVGVKKASQQKQPNKLYIYEVNEC